MDIIDPNNPQFAHARASFTLLNLTYIQETMLRDLVATQKITFQTAPQSGRTTVSRIYALETAFRELDRTVIMVDVWRYTKFPETIDTEAIYVINTFRSNPYVVDLLLKPELKDDFVRLMTVRPMDMPELLFPGPAPAGNESGFYDEIGLTVHEIAVNSIANAFDQFLVDHPNLV